jgi:hypothetical protein
MEDEESPPDSASMAAAAAVAAAVAAAGACRGQAGTRVLTASCAAVTAAADGSRTKARRVRLAFKSGGDVMVRTAPGRRANVAAASAAEACAGTPDTASQRAPDEAATPAKATEEAVGD